MKQMEGRHHHSLWGMKMAVLGCVALVCMALLVGALKSGSWRSRHGQLRALAVRLGWQFVEGSDWDFDDRFVAWEEKEEEEG